MGLNVNKKLLPVKLYFFTKYAGVSSFPFLPALTRQKGIPTAGIGLIWTVMPLTSAAANMCMSTVADAFKIHKAVFLSAMVLLAASFVTIICIPDIPRPPSNPVEASVISLCGHSNISSLVVCPSVSSEQSLFPLLHPNFDNCSDASVECKVSCRISNEVSNGTVPVSNAGNSFVNISLLSKDICNWNNCSIVRNISYEIGCNKIYDAVCEDVCGLDEDPGISFEYLFKTVEFWFLMTFLVMIYAGNSIYNTMADTICFVILGQNRHKYGQQRLWGSLATGTFGLAGGALVSVFSQGQPQPNYTPMFIISITFCVVNLFVSSRVKVSIPKKEKLKASSVSNLLCSIDMIIFLVTVLVVSTNMGTIWAFYLIVMEDVATSWNPEFAYIKLLQGLSIGAESFLGEVPFMFLSAYIIKRLGNVHTFSVTLVTTSIRLLLYATVSNPWYFLPIQLLHGLSFGVFFPNMVSYTNYVAPKGAQATVLGIVKTCFMGGMSLGGLVGGILIQRLGGSLTFLYLGMFTAAYSASYVILHLVLNAIRTRNVQDDGRGNYEAADKKLSEPVKTTTPVGERTLGDSLHPYQLGASYSDLS